MRYSEKQMLACWEVAQDAFSETIEDLTTVDGATCLQFHEWIAYQSEETCRWEYDGEAAYKDCSGSKWEGPIAQHLKYCPNCGSRIVT